MSFGSFEFLAFLPIVIAGYFVFSRWAPRAGVAWLVLASLVSYARAGWQGLPYLLAAALFNFWLGRMLAAGGGDATFRRRLLQFGLVANVGQLLVVKYSAFLLGLAGFDRYGVHGVLPVGISFYTLIQVMYLLDCYEGLTEPHGILEHLLFSSFFPYVAVGPLTRSRDMQPLLRPNQRPTFNSDDAARGAELFVLGLFKKAVLAQSCAHLADSGWGLPRPSMIEAWIATLAFAFELYFDFGGYSDMAVGAALFFGVKLPLNFDSPYKSTSIIAFWRRWHISLSNFITTYMYTPLVRLRRRPTLTWAMAMTVLAMAIAGLWHGAAWTFVLFGLLHGLALVINNLWRKTKRRVPVALGWLLTFMFVVATLVLFRAASLAAAGNMFASMLGAHGVAGFSRDLFISGGPSAIRAVIAVMGAVACFLTPNSNAIAKAFAPSCWRAIAIGVVALIALVFMNSLAAKDFIYRDF